jgi:hypothetical protein
MLIHGGNLAKRKAILAGVTLSLNFGNIPIMMVMVTKNSREEDKV